MSPKDEAYRAADEVWDAFNVDYAISLPTPQAADSAYYTAFMSAYHAAFAAGAPAPTALALAGEAAIGAEDAL